MDPTSDRPPDLSPRPGRVALFGSGETARAGRRVHELLLARYEKPVPVAVIETPAGFQPNSAILAEKVCAFFEHSLQNFKPHMFTIPARRRGGGALGTDDPSVAEPISRADYIFAGAGSPTYAVRHLADSLVWRLTRERLRAGATLALASAMALAVSAQTLPVYEIYKVGTDLHWTPGLNLLAEYGLDLTIVPHWNNAEGGAELDTSRCYMGQDRFDELRAQLPTDTVFLGIDEHTIAVMDLATEDVQVHGVGEVTVIRAGDRQTFTAGASFPLQLLWKG
ncbi:MAG: cysteinyl-tRNA synthetase [Chloroflexi bacterium]|nr:cysteinyl-tRNA synthetase [Chloroflexota bacterium]